LIFCGKCGKGLVGRAAHRNGHRHKYYSCANRTYHRGCKLPFIRADIVEVLTIKEIQSIFRQPELLEKVWQLVNTKLQEERRQKQNEICKVAEDIVKTKSALERYFVEFEAGSIEQDVLRDRVTGLNLRIQQLQEEKAKLEEELEMLNLEGIDQDGIKAYIDALEVVLENGENEQKKHLLRVLVEKVLVHDKDRYEFWFRLPDGKIFDQSFQNAENGDSNSLSVSQLAEQVGNHIQLARRTVVTANRRWGVRMFTELIYDGRPQKRKFIRENLKIGFRKPRSHKPRIMGNIGEGVSHFLCPEHKVWLPKQRYYETLEEKRNARIILAEDWLQGLKNGIYQNRADIARKNNCSRAWVTKVMNSLSE